MKLQDFIDALKKYPPKDTARFFHKLKKTSVYVDGMTYDNDLVNIIFDYDEAFHSLNYETIIRYFEQILLACEKEPIIRFREFGGTALYEVLEHGNS